jgi:hypothetical protein
LVLACGVVEILAHAAKDRLQTSGAEIYPTLSRGSAAGSVSLASHRRLICLPTHMDGLCLGGLMGAERLALNQLEARRPPLSFWDRPRQAKKFCG